MEVSSETMKDISSDLTLVFKYLLDWNSTKINESYWSYLMKATYGP